MVYISHDMSVAAAKNARPSRYAALAEDDFLPVANDAVSLEGECTSSNADIT